MAADKFTDAVGNNNTAATQFNWTYDGVKPIIVITASDGTNAVANNDTTNDATLTVTFTSSKATTNFAASDITVTGGAISNFSATSSTVYTATFTPSAAGATTIDVGDDKFTEHWAIPMPLVLNSNGPMTISNRFLPLLFPIKREPQ